MPSPNRKRLLRISLRTMLVVVTVLCVLLGWKVRQTERQKAAAGWVKAVGGNVQYDYEWNDAGWIPDAELPGPDWLRQLIGVDYFASVAEVSLNDGVIHDLSPLYELKKLRMLVLWEPLVQVPDEEIAAFEKALPNCEIFSPCFMPVHGELGRIDCVVEEVGGS